MNRILTLATVALAAIPAAAPAQNVGGLLRTFGSLTLSTNSYCYANGAMGQAGCRANQAVNVIDRLDQVDRQRRFDRQWEMTRERERMSNRTSTTNALSRACRAGDRESCDRVQEDSYGRNDDLRRALIDACSAGDRRSCDRLGGRFR